MRGAGLLPLLGVVALFALIGLGCGERQAPVGCEHPPVVEACQGGFCSIPAGCYWYWWPPPCARDQARPVRLTQAFEMQQLEATCGQAQQALGRDVCQGLDKGSAPDLPARVSWHDAARWANELSRRAGLESCYVCGAGPSETCVVMPAFEGSGIYACRGYRLPTVAEWSYAYRAGTLSRWYNGDWGCDFTGELRHSLLTAITWLGTGLHVGGQKLPNGWGLHDMAGNAGEWTHEIVAPGGSARDYPPSPQPWQVPEVDPVATVTGIDPDPQFAPPARRTSLVATGPGFDRYMPISVEKSLRSDFFRLMGVRFVRRIAP